MQAIVEDKPSDIARFFASKTLQFSIKGRKTCDFIHHFAIWFPKLFGPPLRNS